MTSMEPQQDITLAEIYLTPLIAYRWTSPIVAVSRADYTAYVYNTTLGTHPATQTSALWTSSFVLLKDTEDFLSNALKRLDRTAKSFGKSFLTKLFFLLDFSVFEFLLTGCNETSDFIVG